MTAIDIDGPSRQVRRTLARQAAKGGRGTPSSSASRVADAGRRDPGEAPGRGLFDGNCNRTACQAPIADGNWFNVSTRLYYCGRCAGLLNTESLRFDGIRICVSVEAPDDQPPFPYDEMRRHREERVRMRG